MFDCASVMHESILVPTLTYASEVMVWRSGYRSRVRAVEMDNLRSILGVLWMDEIENEIIRGVCRVQKSLNVKISESNLPWFGHDMRMEDGRIVKRV